MTVSTASQATYRRCHLKPEWPIYKQLEYLPMLFEHRTAHRC